MIYCAGCGKTLQGERFEKEKLVFHLSCIPEQDEESAEHIVPTPPVKSRGRPAMPGALDEADALLSLVNMPPMVRVSL